MWSVAEALDDSLRNEKLQIYSVSVTCKLIRTKLDQLKKIHVEPFP